MKQSLAVAYAVKRKAKGMSAGGKVESEPSEQAEIMEERSESADELFSVDPENERKSRVANAVKKHRK